MAALCELDNVVLTPQLGSLAVKARQAMRALCFDKLRAHIAGRPAPTPVPRRD